MEIITYVRKGAITHEDSLGNKGKTNAGDVQVMSAGTGVKHSEHNLEDETTSLYQIWIKPNALNVEPRWDAMEFPKEHVENKLNLIVGGSDEAPLFIHADADIYAGKIQAKKELMQFEFELKSQLESTKRESNNMLESMREDRRDQRVSMQTQGQKEMIAQRKQGDSLNNMEAPGNDILTESADM